jgi:hypothetical protein
LYFFVNGGEDGTWPSGENGELTGYDAPEDLETGYLGFVNNLIGPKGAISEMLEDEGYTSCASLPTDDEEFTVEDEKLGELTVTVGDSSKEIPDGLRNEGDFEKRIHIATADDTVAVVHLHCSSTIMTMLARLNIEMDNEDQVEYVEAIMEGSLEGPDVHLQFINQNPANEAEDMAIEFRTTDGDEYTISVAYTSNKTDSNGNGPAHILASVTGSREDGKANLTVMGGNTDATGLSASSDMTGLVFDADAEFADMDEDNTLCLDLEDASETTGCPDANYPSDPAITGLAAWTIEATHDLKTGDATVEDIDEY